MPKFAVYYIPPAQSSLYQHGSEILGYDVRTGTMLPEDNPTRAALPEFDPAWAALPQTYGFHVTMGYSLYFDGETLPQIEQEMEDVFNCFSPDVEFIFTPASERVVFWQDEIVVLRYDPNPALLMLHTMLIARVNPLGTGSNMSEVYTQKDVAAFPLVNLHRVRKYYTPYMLDGWTPHFTLMMPYKGTQPEAVRVALLDLFDNEPIKVESICLLVRQDGETHYRLYREFCFKAYPKSIVLRSATEHT
jgi:hypothetical protein